MPFRPLRRLTRWSYTRLLSKNQDLFKFFFIDRANFDENSYIVDADDIVKYHILENCQKVDGVAGLGDYGCKLPIGILEMDYGYDNSLSVNSIFEKRLFYVFLSRQALR